MTYAYVRDGIVEFIEVRPNIERLYPQAILSCFIPLTAEQEKFVCKGCTYNCTDFIEPLPGSEIPNIGGIYTPIRNDEEPIGEE